MQSGQPGLSEPYRSIFKLLIEEDLSLISIARHLEIKPGSIYKQYERGIRRLRQAMGVPD